MLLPSFELVEGDEMSFIGGGKEMELDSGRLGSCVSALASADHSSLRRRGFVLMTSAIEPNGGLVS
jgi:hypothetical protein